jgi:hypothetical protein
MAEWAGQLVLVIGYLTLGFDDCRLAWEGLLMLNSNISDVACLQDALRTSIGTICNLLDDQVRMAVATHQQVLGQRFESISEDTRVALNGSLNS